MTRTVRLAASLALVLLLASPLALAADRVFGKGVGKAPLVKVSELLENPGKWVDKPVRVEGLVTAVCKKRGCWMEIAGDKEFQSIRFKVQDGAMVFPAEVVGHRAEVEGTFVKIVLPPKGMPEKKVHEAEAKGEVVCPESVKGYRALYMIRGTGAVVHF